MLYVVTGNPREKAGREKLLVLHLSGAQVGDFAKVPGRGSTTGYQ